MDQTIFFLQTSQELRQLFEKSFVTRQLKAGEVLFEQDEFDDKLYVLDEGLMEVSVFAVSGRKLSLNLLRSGSVFGEIAMFDPGPRTARIEALKDCKLRSIQQSTLIAKVSSEPALAVELLGLAGKRMRWMAQQIESQVFLSSSARLAANLMHFADETGDISMSQTQLADYVGVTREVVSKTLSEWRREGFVALSRGHIKVCDKVALDKIRYSDVL